MVHVLFVCLGNICRSPMAEAVMQRLVDEAGLSDQISIDSAGTGSWHTGEAAHRGTRDVLARNGISYRGRARQVAAADYRDPTHYVIAMDASNVRDLERRFGQHPNLHRLLDFATQTDEGNVPDPYYSDNFDYVYRLVDDGCRGLLDHIRAEHNL